MLRPAAPRTQTAGVCTPREELTIFCPQGRRGKCTSLSPPSGPSLHTRCVTTDEALGPLRASIALSATSMKWRPGLGLPTFSRASQ
jgi:hypothetical protein